MATKSRQPPIMAVIGDRVKDRPQRVKHAHLDDEDKLLIIYGLDRGWAVGKIARAVPCSPSTVKNFKNHIFDDPGQVFQLRVLVKTGPRSHQCQVCGETRPSRIKGMRHVLSHIFPYEMARDMPLDEVEKPL